MKSKNQNMNDIEQLLEKYWLCETTVSEEQELREFFLREEIPGHLVKYRAMFSLQEEEPEVSLDESFDRKILGMIGAEQKPGRRFTLHPALRVAASVVVILGLWFAIQFLNRQHNDPWKQDTYQTPEQALAEVQKVLAGLSVKMEESQELLKNQMEKVEPLTSIIKR